MSQDITVAVAKPQRDAKAEEQFHKHGVTTHRYVERIKRRIRKAGASGGKTRHKNEIRVVEKSLHPRYVFAGTVDQDTIGAVLADDHESPKASISSMLGRTREDDLDSLKAIDGRDVDPDALPSFVKPAIGEIVTPVWGCYEGFKFRVDGDVGDKFRTTLGMIKIRIPYAHLQPYQATHPG